MSLVGVVADSASHHPPIKPYGTVLEFVDRTDDLSAIRLRRLVVKLGSRLVARLTHQDIVHHTK